MKTMFKTLSVIGLMAASLAVNAQDKIIQLSQLPKQAQTFLKAHGATNGISYIKMEDELFKKSYEVKMNDGSEFEFDKNGNWKEIDLKHKAVPAALIPKPIKVYVAKSFPNNKIVKISKESSKYEVELSNGLDLEFNSKGKFLRIDD